MSWITCEPCGKTVSGVEIGATWNRLEADFRSGGASIPQRGPVLSEGSIADRHRLKLQSRLLLGTQGTDFEQLAMQAAFCGGGIFPGGQPRFVANRPDRLRVSRPMPDGSIVSTGEEVALWVKRDAVHSRGMPGGITDLLRRRAGERPEQDVLVFGS